MALTQMRCTDCGGKNVAGCRTYTIKDGAQRTMYHCASCGGSFSETKQTPLAHLKTTIRCKAKSSQDTGVPGLRGAQHGFALNAPGA
jgi:DNA-directed RNA polymerase subunit RPC12/RpoP